MLQRNESSVYAFGVIVRLLFELHLHSLDREWPYARLSFAVICCFLLFPLALRFLLITSFLLFVLRVPFRLDLYFSFFLLLLLIAPPPMLCPLSRVVARHAHVP